MHLKEKKALFNALNRAGTGKLSLPNLILPRHDQKSVWSWGAHLKLSLSKLEKAGLQMERMLRTEGCL